MIEKGHKTLDAYCFDMDGCILNNDYHEYKKREARGELASDEIVTSPLVSFNTFFLEAISREITVKKPQRVLILNGSARQDRKIDLVNMDRDYYRLPSVCSALSELAENIRTCASNPQIDIQLDKYWVSDSYNQLEEGTSFDERKKEVDSGRLGNLDCRWFFDETKITILYAHMHRLSTANPGKEIVFNFYDDRLDILTGLSDFFRKNPALIPYNVSLRLHNYKGDRRTEAEKTSGKSCVTQVDEIHGTGIADHDYANSLRSIVKLAGYEAELNNNASGNWGTDEHKNISNLPVDKFIKERTARLAQANNDKQQACDKAFNSWPESCLDFLNEAITAFKNKGKDEDTDTVGREKTTFSRDLEALFNVLKEDIEKQKTAKVPTEQILGSSAITICRATRTMLDALAELPKEAPVEQKIAILKAYEAACRDTSGWMTFAKAIGAVVISALVFLIVSGVLMGWASGAGIFKDIIAGWKDILAHDMTEAATQLIANVSTGVMFAGWAGAAACLGFFKPSEAAKKVSNVINASGVDLVPKESANDGPISFESALNV